MELETANAPAPGTPTYKYTDWGRAHTPNEALSWPYTGTITHANLDTTSSSLRIVGSVDVEGGPSFTLDSNYLSRDFPADALAKDTVLTFRPDKEGRVCVIENYVLGPETAVRLSQTRTVHDSGTGVIIVFDRQSRCGHIWDDERQRIVSLSDRFARNAGSNSPKIFDQLALGDRVGFEANASGVVLNLTSHIPAKHGRIVTTVFGQGLIRDSLTGKFVALSRKDNERFWGKLGMGARVAYHTPPEKPRRGQISLITAV